VILCFVCLRPVAFVPNVASISGLSFLDCSVDFLYRLFSSCLHMLCNVLNQFWVADSGTTLNGGRRFQVIIRKTCQWPIVGECHVSSRYSLLSNLSLSMIFLMDFGTVPKMWYFFIFYNRVRIL
jgi:hypothetical protein